MSSSLDVKVPSVGGRATEGPPLGRRQFGDKSSVIKHFGTGGVGHCPALLMIVGVSGSVSRYPGASQKVVAVLFCCAFVNVQFEFFLRLCGNVAPVFQ